MHWLQFLLSFKGRTPRVGFWLFYFTHAFVYGMISILLYEQARPYFGEEYQRDQVFTPLVPLFALFTVIFFIPAAAVTTRRLHDRGRSGWWVLLGLGLAILAYTTVVTYSDEFRRFHAMYGELPRRDLMRLIMVVAVFAMIGYAPWSIAILVFSRGNAQYSYILPALVGVGPLVLFGLWFLVEVGFRRGQTSANAYGPAPKGYFGTSGVSPAGRLKRGGWQIAGAGVAMAGAIVLLTGALEVREAPCDLTLAPRSSTASANEFEDCFDVLGTRVCGPPMVILPMGSFQMGSSRQTPIHTVTFAKPFAIGKFELTYAQWEACVADGGCRKRQKFGRWQDLSRDPSGARCRRPVGVSWNEAANEYLPWLSRRTGKPYRLPSESEWEYAARAGTATGFPAGDVVRGEYENFDDSEGQTQFGAAWADPNRTYTSEEIFVKDTCAASTHKGQELDVGSLKANAFGLHDMLGNTWEFVADIYNSSYDGAPSDGSAAHCTSTNFCDYRVIRGGSSCTPPGMLTPTFRSLGSTRQTAGFRAALSMD